MSDMRYVITEYAFRDTKGVLSFSLDSKKNVMTSVNFTPFNQKDNIAVIGDIFVAKVTNVAKQLNAAFIL